MRELRGEALHDWGGGVVQAFKAGRVVVSVMNAIKAGCVVVSVVVVNAIGSRRDTSSHVSQQLMYGQVMHEFSSSVMGGHFGIISAQQPGYVCSTSFSTFNHDLSEESALFSLIPIPVSCTHVLVCIPLDCLVSTHAPVYMYVMFHL